MLIWISIFIPRRAEMIMKGVIFLLIAIALILFFGIFFNKNIFQERIGNLCAGEANCFEFCLSNDDQYDQCEQYCSLNSENNNKLCREMYPDIFWAREKPVLSLPFDENAKNLIPMGETITRNGFVNSGIDFNWEKEVKILASFDGEIIYLSQRTADQVNAGVWDIYIGNGKYGVGYIELGAVNPDIYLGKTVKRGEWLGNSWHNGSNEIPWTMHWEFGYLSKSYYPGSDWPYLDKLCPLAYFDDSSIQRIEKIWNETIWDFKKDFPYICNTIYFRRSE